MSKAKKNLSLVMLGAIPLAYTRLYKKTYGNRSDSPHLKPLPRVELPDNNFYLTEADYGEQMKTVVFPELIARETINSFETTHRINYGFYRADHPKANLVISHGYAEEIARYAEPIYYFLQMGFNVWIPEHFGHGASDAGVQDPSVVWVDDFDTYSFDLHRFIQDVVKPADPGLPVICYAHSMGGAIVARCMELYRDFCAGAILTSPMLQVHLFQAESLIFPLTQLVSKTPLSRSHIVGETRFQKQLPDNFVAEKAATTSQVRGTYAHMVRWDVKKDPRYAVSWGWINESLKASHEIVKKHNVEKIHVPLLMFQAENDWFVDKRGMYAFAEHARDLEFYLVPGSRHEIYSETDEIIVPYFNKIHQFIEEILSGETVRDQEKSLPKGFR